MGRPRRIRPEDSDRFQRCCPYCFAPVKWSYTASASLSSEHPYVDLKSERPSCVEHGPLPMWVVVDNAHPLRIDPTLPVVHKPAILAVATVDDLPAIPEDVYGPPWPGNAKARILPRTLRTPIFLDDAKRMSARWKQTRETRREAKKQPTLLQIDLAAIMRREWSRRAA